MNIRLCKIHYNTKHNLAVNNTLKDFVVLSFCSALSYNFT